MDLIIAMVGHVDETCIRKIYDATVPLIKVCPFTIYKAGLSDRSETFLSGTTVATLDVPPCSDDKVKIDGDK